jgi:hypothetical protein
MVRESLGFRSCGCSFAVSNVWEFGCLKHKQRECWERIPTLSNGGMTGAPGWRTAPRMKFAVIYSFFNSLRYHLELSCLSPREY